MSNNLNQQSGPLADITTYAAGIVQSSVHRKLQKVSDEVLIPYGITKMQWMIIGTVLDHRTTGMRITDLSNKLGTNLSYMTNTVNLLESKNILARIENAVDSRSRLITVNPKFAVKCNKIEKSLRTALKDEVYSKVSKEDFNTYIKVLFQLAETEN